MATLAWRLSIAARTLAGRNMGDVLNLSGGARNRQSPLGSKADVCLSDLDHRDRLGRKIELQLSSRRAAAERLWRNVVRPVETVVRIDRSSRQDLALSGRSLHSRNCCGNAHSPVGI